MSARNSQSPIWIFATFSGYPVATIPADPCVPTPCGPNSNCRQVGETAVCSCLPNYVGRSPNCRPECTTNSECSRSLACINERCVDPCRGSCGSFATCYVNNHRPICTCLDQYTGDPFSACSPIPSNEKLNWSIARPFLNIFDFHLRRQFIVIHRKLHRSHAFHRHVVRMLCAVNKIMPAHAVVCPSIMAIRM